MTERCQVKAPEVAEVAQRISWARICDACMHRHGISCTRGMQAVLILAHKGFESRGSLLHHLQMLQTDSLDLEEVRSECSSRSLLNFKKLTKLNF